MRAPTPSVDGDVDDSILSEPELEYDEALIEESDDSGSEFQASEEESNFSQPDDGDSEEKILKPRKSPRKNIHISEMEDSSDDEALMLNAAIHMSLQTARLDVSSSAGAGPSSSSLVSSKSGSVLRAAAAERRLARAKQGIDEANFDEVVLPTESEALSSDSEEEALWKGKGKAKTKAAKKAVIYDTSSTKIMSMPEMRKMRREERKRLLADRRQNKKEESALAKKLGRKLTIVSCIPDGLYPHL